MKYLSIFAGIFLLALFFFSWGFMAAEHEKFPRSVIKPLDEEIVAFLKGGDGRERVLNNLKHELGINPGRMFKNFWKNENRDYRTLEIKGLRERRTQPLLHTKESGAFPPGYIIIWGAFDFEDSLHAAILINEKGRVIHKWIPDPDAFKEKIEERNKEKQDGGDKIKYKTPRDLPQGFSIFPDGSVIFNDGDSGNGMQKIDFCSEPEWVKLGRFNHSITKQKGGSALWTIDGDTVNMLHKIDSETGRTLNNTGIADIMRSNPEHDILSLRYDDFDNKWLNDRWHFNDVEPLPVEYADAFDDFAAGDLLLSSRSLNMLMVVDAVSDKIKWSKIGEFSRQHDPDWQADGSITVYDNQTRDVFGGRGPKKGDGPKFSRILRIKPGSGGSDILYDGKKDRFYSNIRGKHQILPDGSILITSSAQGRIMITDKNGETVFEFLNKYDDEKALLVSEAVWVPKDFFDFDPAEKNCSTSGT